jgi:hypothetical protein
VGRESSLSELPRHRITDPARDSSPNEVRPVLDAVSIPPDTNSSPCGNVVVNQRAETGVRLRTRLQRRRMQRPYRRSITMKRSAFSIPPQCSSFSIMLPIPRRPSVCRRRRQQGHPVDIAIEYAFVTPPRMREFIAANLKYFACAMQAFLSYVCRSGSRARATSAILRYVSICIHWSFSCAICV